MAHSFSELPRRSEDEPDILLCPITQQVMKDPAFDPSDGMTYERSARTRKLEAFPGGQELINNLRKDYRLINILDNYRAFMTKKISAEEFANALDIALEDSVTIFTFEDPRITKLGQTHSFGSIKIIPEVAGVRKDPNTRDDIRLEDLRKNIKIAEIVASEAVLKKWVADYEKAHFAKADEKAAPDQAVSAQSPEVVASPETSLSLAILNNAVVDIGMNQAVTWPAFKAEMAEQVASTNHPWIGLSLGVHNLEHMVVYYKVDANTKMEYKTFDLQTQLYDLFYYVDFLIEKQHAKIYQAPNLEHFERTFEDFASLISQYESRKKARHVEEREMLAKRVTPETSLLIALEHSGVVDFGEDKDTQLAQYKAFRSHITAQAEATGHDWFCIAKSTKHKDQFTICYFQKNYNKLTSVSYSPEDLIGEVNRLVSGGAKIFQDPEMARVPVDQKILARIKIENAPPASAAASAKAPAQAGSSRFGVFSHPAASGSAQPAGQNAQGRMPRPGGSSDKE